jgi:5'-deoxynucleotidase YfbR-like HD superfamily hydrolase
VKDWIADDTLEPALIQEFTRRFRELDFRKETKRGASVYNGIFNLFVIQGARDWITGNIPQHDDLDDHHIVPASWGAKHLPGNTVHTILNRSPLTGDTNRKVIGDKLPNAYLPELIEKNGETTVRAILESHFISPKAFEILLRDPFTPDDFENFLVERHGTLLDAIESHLINKRLDLPPQLRELDGKAEDIELALRKVISESLDHDWALLPPHVQNKIEDRIQRNARKNAAFNEDRYQGLIGKLEYSDLRELEDIISAKATWERFRERFVNKEALVTRFDQLAELRNGIRHSRTVDEITRKEGEAALLWFRQVLNK